MDNKIDVINGGLMDGKKIAKLIYLIAGLITILEFLFVRGMFTWLIVVTLVIITGIVNIIMEIKDKNYMGAAHYIVTSVALCMGYMVLGA